MSRKFLLSASLLFAYVFAQQPGTITPEVHPSLISQKCTKAGGCKAVNTSIVLDASFRWLHNVGGSTNCVNGGFNTSFCPDVATCAKGCAVEGVDYSTYGIKTQGDSLTLNLFKQQNNVTTEASPRVYLLANDTTYDLLMLLNQELTFDVDVSKVPCGINGALYLSEMDATGKASDLNQAGAKYGTGYCDAQCPKNTFVNGLPNINGTLGACCNEMDIWEANSATTAFTPHSCNITGTYACTGAACTGSGVCDQGGCDFNAYRMGATGFYGPNKTVDTTRKFTVVTQFITADGTATGTLKTISRSYVQDGKVISNANVSIPGMAATNSIDDTYCNAQTKAFGGVSTYEQRGGMAGMGSSLARGMVLIFSIWMDSGSGMQWLDGTTGNSTGDARGPCSATSGNTTMLTAMYPDAAVTFSNIKVGDLGTTFGTMQM
ncbi:related to cellulose 1,4-beta-cellobiosidase [Phialocephala subalpina]|uniref:Glucanase n=1 Tax=Phialocephala subalpina TaxID=576137 RepID=A0A1L7XQ13_9HELO|nr:related to cellulose 1,4-beta-cellobiosidase [Phialocephala subalpina]